MSSEKEPRPDSGEVLLGFLWPVAVICLALSPRVVWLRALLHVHVRLLANNGFQSEGLQEVDRTYYSVTPAPFS